MKPPNSLAARLMTAQVIVVVIGSLTLAVTAVLVTPGLFQHHLALAGGTSPQMAQHAEEALTSAIVVSLTLATLAALVAAGLTSWLFVRRFARPVQRLAAAADALAAGHFELEVPSEALSAELQRLSDAFTNMASRLASTDAARSQLLSDLSHELRTPLATLTAYIDGMEDGVVTPDAQSWETMRHQVDRLRRLTTDVRQAAASAENSLELQLEHVDLAALARTEVAAAAPRFDAQGVRLRLHATGTAIYVRGDAERLSQVLVNLLDNALRYTPASGQVEVAVTSTGTGVMLRVHDTGSGIPDGESEIIFDRFYRADPARAALDVGSGLGLTIARAIVNSHHGTLTAANNRPAPGATFTMRLPAHDNTRAPARGRAQRRLRHRSRVVATPLPPMPAPPL